MQTDRHKEDNCKDGWREDTKRPDGWEGRQVDEQIDIQILFYRVHPVVRFKLIVTLVPSNETRRMYNIQFVLLKLHVSTILSGHHQVNTNVLQVLYRIANRITSHMDPYLQ
jgi:hypothetical protein